MILAAPESRMSVVDNSREFQQFARPHAEAALRLAWTPSKLDEPETVLEAEPDPGPSPEVVGQRS